MNIFYQILRFGKKPEPASCRNDEKMSTKKAGDVTTPCLFDFGYDT